MRYVIVAATIVAALIVRVFFIQVFKVPSDSMSPVILSGDYVLARQQIYEPDSTDLPKHGELVIFVRDSKPFIKRVMAVANDEVEYTGDGQLVLNFPCSYSLIKTDESGSYSHLHETCGHLTHEIVRPAESLHKTRAIAKIRVEKHHLFVISDNRTFETDVPNGEIIKADQIIGKPLFIWLSYGSTQDFISKTLGVRWNRILTKLR